MRAGAGKGGGGGRGSFAQGTDICVYVPLQNTSDRILLPLQNTSDFKRSALHYASSSGLESTVAKLLSLGADAALTDEVRACSYMNTSSDRWSVSLKFLIIDILF